MLAQLGAATLICVSVRSLRVAAAFHQASAILCLLGHMAGSREVQTVPGKQLAACMQSFENDVSEEVGDAEKGKKLFELSQKLVGLV